MSDLFDDTRALTIKALTLWQPWASLMAAGLKRHETRHWSTAYRGPIAIHASKTLDLAGAPEQLCRIAFGQDWWLKMPQGAVVAVGRLRLVRPACIVEEAITRADMESGNFTIGRFAWEVDQLRPLERPIPLTGRQGLFNWTPPDDLDARLLPAVDHAAASAAIGWG